MPADARGRLEQDPFAIKVTKAGQVFITRDGRQLTVLAGDKARKLVDQLARAAPGERQLLLAKATGNYRRGNERAV